MVSKEQEEKILEETKLLVETFLKTRESDIDLGKRCGISSSTVGRRLTNKDRIVALYGQNGDEIYKKVMAIRNENLQRGKMIGSQTSMLNHVKEGEMINSPKLLLGVFFASPEKQQQFLFHLALTTRAKPQLLEELFGIDQNEIVELFEKTVGPSAYGAIKYYLEIDDYDQELAKSKILTLYRDMLLANKNNDKKEKVRIIKEVTDDKAAKFRKKWQDYVDNKTEVNRKSCKLISDEEIEVVLRYQLKYALTDYIVAEQFYINRPNYRLRVQQLLENNMELYRRYEQLADRNNYDNRKEFGFNRGQY